ncbi:MAG: stage II sporulation protein M [Candidatus Hydrogenedentes bacterium]|nr:stage II sporulation protein M [Candidatus Hydrogenedentota bacterium]
MIIDLEKFIASEQPYWDELDHQLTILEERSGNPLSLEQVKRFNYLYQRTASDLARISTFSAEPTTRRHLENLVARAYAEVHEVRRSSGRIQAGEWVMKTFPQTFRRHIRAFQLTLFVTLLGAAFGALVVATDSPAKRVILPFDHLMGSPSDRVAREEAVTEDRMAGSRSVFSAQLMQNNIRVSIMALALGMTFGLGTFLVLFYNGVILGAVVFDYMADGQTVFLLGWLLPHGSIELPAIFLAGQAGLVLAHALIGFGDHHVLSARLRAVGPDLVTLITGVAIMLVWAGIVESFFSQYHEPHLPYWLKISFGTLELAALVVYLSRAGRAPAEDNARTAGAPRPA